MPTTEATDPRPQDLAAHLRRLLSDLASILQTDPHRALGQARETAKWILADLGRTASGGAPEELGSAPAALGYDRLFERADAAGILPRRIQIQFKAIATFGTADDHSDSGLGRGDVLPCLQALDTIVQWYLRDHLRSPELIDFLPDRDTAASGSAASGERPPALRGPHDEPQRQAPERRAARHRRPVLRRLLPALLSLVIVGLFVVKVREVATAAGRRMGYTLEQAPVGIRITDLDPEGAAFLGGLRDGDVVLEINRHSLNRTSDYDRPASEFEPGTPATFHILRGGETAELTVTPGSPVDWREPLISGFVMLCCLFLSAHMLYRSPGYGPRLFRPRRSGRSRVGWRGDLRGLLLGIFFALVALELALPMSAIGAPFLENLAWLLFLLNTGAQIGVHLHLASLIPERPRWLARHPFVVRLYYLFGLSLGTSAAGAYLAEWISPRTWLPWSYEEARTVLYDFGLPLWAGAVMILLAIPTIRFPQPQGRRQAGVVLLGFLPWSVYIFAVTALEIYGGELPMWVDPFFPLLVLCFPVAIWAVLELESRSHRKILFSLAREIRQLDSVGEISKLITDDMEAAFHATRTHVFFQQGPSGGLSLGHSSGARTEVKNVPEHFELLRIAEQSDEALMRPDDLTELPREELDWLRRLEARVIVPLNDSRHGLVGLLLLGDKRTEEAYSDRDFKLLHSLAGQIAMSFENIGLQSRLQEKDRIQREVLSRLQDQDINLVKECPTCGSCFDSAAEQCRHEGSELVLSVPVERTIVDRYRLDRVLGKGGIGAVYEAIDLRLDRPVAVKVLLGSVLDKVHVQLRFEREARVIAQLNHPNIVAVYDYGQTSVGNAFIVLELLQGTTLRSLMHRSGALTPERIAAWLDPVLEGLKAAHRLGVIHRDLKPGNVFIAEDEHGRREVKLLDFGIAKVKSNGAETQNLTVPGVVLGTVGYMAPEQVLGTEVDERTDIYSIGVLVTEALLGQRPFQGRTPIEVMNSIGRTTLELPAGNPAEAALSKILRRCLQRNPGERYRSIAKLQKVLIPELRACPPIRGLGDSGVRDEATEELRPRRKAPAGRRTEEI
ncbi:MAG: protein kinase [Thermoanaerobaculia bacterium]